MLQCKDEAQKSLLQNELRKLIVPGSIDVNIMTKLDRDVYKDGEMLPHKFADAMSALRGYAKSKLDSFIIFSAGLKSKTLFLYC